MSEADDLAELRAALRRVLDAQEKDGKELDGLRARLGALVELLVARGGLAASHVKTLDKAERAAGQQRSPIHLSVWVDKYAIPEGDIDCAARIPLCHARCCAMSFPLSAQDLDEGAVRWELDAPYLIRHGRDGWCHHIDRDGGGCTIYEQRPATCRQYDCRGDPRVWLDFDARIPAPLAEGLAPLGQK